MKILKVEEKIEIQKYETFHILNIKNNLYVLGIADEFENDYGDLFYKGNLIYYYDGELNEMYEGESFSNFEIDKIDNLIVYTSNDINEIFSKLDFYWSTITYNL